MDFLIHNDLMDMCYDGKGGVFWVLEVLDLFLFGGFVYYRWDTPWTLQVFFCFSCLFCAFGYLLTGAINQSGYYKSSSESCRHIQTDTDVGGGFSWQLPPSRFR